MPITLCPYCGQQVNELHLDELEAQPAIAANPRIIPAVAFLCPHCNKILGVATDPNFGGDND